MCTEAVDPHETLVKRPTPPGRRLREGSGPPIPGPDLHAGMFRDRTVQEVLRIREVLRSDTAHDVVLEALIKLDDFCMDRDVLARTSIGKDIGALRKHTNPAVARQAESLHDAWRRDHRTREQVVDGFSEKGQLMKRDARELEEGLFNAACPLGLLEGEGYRSYQRHYKRLCTHLRARGPGTLVQRILDGEVGLLEAAWLPDSEIMSGEQRQREQQAHEAGLRAALVGPGQKGTPTEEYTCPKCKGSNCAYTELNTGWHQSQQDITILVSCLGCGEHWKAHDDHGLAA